MSLLLNLLPFVVMMVVLYLMIFIPEKKRKKNYQSMVDGLKVNDHIMTKGGIMGKLVKINDDYIILESGPDRARLKFTKQAIATVLDNTQAEENREVSVDE